MITVLYFASLRERLGLEQEQLNTDIKNTSQLKQLLCARGDQWEEAINDTSTQIALNQQLSDWNSEIPEEAEIALFPPITGG